MVRGVLYTWSAALCGLGCIGVYRAFGFRVCVECCMRGALWGFRVQGFRVRVLGFRALGGFRL